MDSLSIEDAVKILNKGGVIAYPTETYYGLGCKINSEKAISRIFQTKKRLYAMPLPIIVADLDQAFGVVSLSPELAEDLQKLAQIFWPGPLSCILPAKANLSDLLTGGSGKVALRISPHPIACRLAKECGAPIVASSANISGQAPARLAQELDQVLLEKLDGVIKSLPEPAGGAASTMIELLGKQRYRLQRQGALEQTKLQSAGFFEEV